jgi:uncharacterized membrane protein YjjP (DUF1212 family)
MLEDYNMDILFEWIILTISIIFIFLGFGGLIVVITTSKINPDLLLDYAYAFVYSYMLILGILLLTYRKKILIK